MPFSALKLMAASLLLATRLVAHDPGLSTCSIQLCPTRVEATLVFAWKDFERLTGNSTNFSRSPIELCQLATRVLALDVDGRRMTARHVECRFEGTDNVVIELNFPSAPASRLEAHSPLMSFLPMGHRQFLSVQTSTGHMLTKELLSTRANSAVVEITPQERVSLATMSHKPAVNPLAAGASGGLAGNHLWLVLSSLSAAGSAWVGYRLIGNSSK